MDSVNIEIIRNGMHDLPSPYSENAAVASFEPALCFYAYRIYFPDQASGTIPGVIIDWRTLDPDGVTVPPQRRAIIDTGFVVIHPPGYDYKNSLVSPFRTSLIISSIEFGPRARITSVLVEVSNEHATPRSLRYGDPVAIAQLYKTVRMIPIKTADSIV